MPPLVKKPPWKGIGGTPVPVLSPTPASTAAPSAAPERSPILEQPSLPTGILPVEFSRVNVAASLTDSQMYRTLSDGTSTIGAQLSFVTPFKGSVVAITVSCTTAVTAGLMTIKAFRKGSVTTASLPMSSGTSVLGSWPKGTITFAAGDTLDLRLTTNAGFLPITLDVEAFVYLTQEVD